jgi:membrane protease YdiL (CAAX protease family)
MGWLLGVLGIVATAGAWSLVRVGRASIWQAMTPLFAVLGAGAVLSGRAGLAGDPRLTGLASTRWWSVPAGLFAGAGAALVLFAATRAFLAIALRSESFARHTGVQYAQRTALGPAAAALSAIVVAAGEELFWRGAVQPSVGGLLDGVWAGPVAAATVVWAAYLVANLASRSLPIVAAAAVGGAVWAWLPLLTGGIAASLICHAGWTALMLVLPPPAGRGMMTS